MRTKILPSLSAMLLTAALISFAPVWAQDDGAPTPSSEALSSPSLMSTSKKYRVAPNEATWKSFLNAFKAYLSQPLTLKATAGKIIKANPALTDMRVKVFNAGGSRVWYFPNVREDSVLFVQAGSASTQADAPRVRVDVLDYPDSINIESARIVRSVKTVTKTYRYRRRKRTKKVKVSGPAFLILAGSNRITGLVWLKAYKPYQGTWYPTSEPFSQIPPYLLKNVSGTAKFSGSDLVLKVAHKDKTTGKLPKPSSTSYNIVMKLNNGHFYLAGAGGGKSAPLSVLTYFVQCLRQGRTDLAKAWLKDPGLISIPKYIGLVGNNQAPYKLVAMATPPSGAPRYRLVTNDKHDLIFDMRMHGKQWTVASIFIAPPDPLAKQLSGTSIGEVAAPPAAVEAK